MEDFIFSPKNQIESTSTDYYCLSGTEDFIDDNNFPRKKSDSKDVLAKKIVRPNSKAQYFIKISNSNKLFNPLSGGLEEKSYSIVDNVCRPSDKFRSVNAKIFDLYLNFLSSKNVLWLNSAEREMI